MFEDWYLNELFSSKIRDAWKLTDYYLIKLIFNIFQETGIQNIIKSPVSINEIIHEKNYPQKVYSSIQWMLDRLNIENFLNKTTKGNTSYYSLSGKMMDYDLEFLKEKAKKIAPDSLAAFNMLKLMADNYPLYLSGKKTGVDIIFSPENIEIATDYYINNLFYNVHNIAGAKILNWDIDQRENPVIIEIGGGLGGGTKEFTLQRLKEKQRISSLSYHFTDIANKMLRNTRHAIEIIAGNLEGFTFQKLDFNKNLAEQGYAENSVDVIWGVNAAHVAVDLRFTLNEFYKTLKPNGSLILSETVRPVGNSMIQQELLLNTLDDYWNVKLDPDIRPRHGFMDWKDWVNAIQTIGFKTQTIPDMSILQERYDNCYVAVIHGKKPN